MIEKAPANENLFQRFKHRIQSAHLNLEKNRSQFSDQTIILEAKKVDEVHKLQGAMLNNLKIFAQELKLGTESEQQQISNSADVPLLRRLVDEYMTKQVQNSHDKQERPTKLTPQYITFNTKDGEPQMGVINYHYLNAESEEKSTIISANDKFKTQWAEQTSNYYSTPVIGEPSIQPSS